MRGSVYWLFVAVPSLRKYSKLHIKTMCTDLSQQFLPSADELHLPMLKMFRIMSDLSFPNPMPQLPCFLYLLRDQLRMFDSLSSDPLQHKWSMHSLFGSLCHLSEHIILLNMFDWLLFEWKLYKQLSFGNICEHIFWNM